MNEATDLNPMIESQPTDTLTWCADVLAYLQLETMLADHKDVLTDEQVSGRFKVLECVKAALRYEATRTAGMDVPDDDDESGHPFVIKGGKQD